MRNLVLETVALKPHLETAGEIALEARDRGEEAAFGWLGDALPWSDWGLPGIARLMGCSLSPRIRRLEQLIAARGVQILPHKIDGLQDEKLRAWAYGFEGDLEALKNYRFGEALLGMGVASSLISWTYDSNYDPRSDLARVHACLHSSAIVYQRTCSVIQQVRPDRIVTFNGRFALSKPIIEAAKHAKLPLLRHERGSTFERYDCYEDAIHNFAHIRERIRELWENADFATREAVGHAFYQRRRGGDGIGWYSYSGDQKQGLVPPKVEGKRRVVYFSSSDDEYAAVTDVYAPGPWRDQLAAVQALIDICSRQRDIELVLRIHPNLKTKPTEHARWKALGEGLVSCISAENPVDSYALLESADIVVTYGSTIGIEAAYWGKPSILLGPTFYAGMQVAQEPKNELELNTLLMSRHALLPTARSYCLPLGHYFLTFGTKFKYYQPTSLSEGTFLGERLGWDPDWVYWLRKQGIGKWLRKFMKRT